jgi:hypothetical protein
MGSVADAQVVGTFKRRDQRIPRHRPYNREGVKARHTLTHLSADFWPHQTRDLGARAIALKAPVSGFEMDDPGHISTCSCYFPPIKFLIVNIQRISLPTGFLASLFSVPGLPASNALA